MNTRNALKQFPENSLGVEPPLERASNVIRIAVTFTWCLSCFLSLNEGSHVPVLCLVTLRLLLLYSSFLTKSDNLDILKTKVLHFSGLGLAWLNSVPRFFMSNPVPSPCYPSSFKDPVSPAHHD